MAVYTFGSGKMGQLGLGNFEDSLVPNLIEALRGKKINKVRSGEQHSLALTEFGDVYVWGRGKEGQLGNGIRENVSTPQVVAALKHERIIDAECGYYHCVSLSDTGRVYTWGKLHTQTAEKSVKQYFGMAVEMVGMQSQSARKIVDASMNKYFSGTANLSKEERNELGNSFGNFVQINQLTPIEITAFLSHPHKVIQVSAGYSYSVAVTHCGEVFTWGFNEKGQLGLGHRFPVDEPKRVDNLWANQIIIKRAACGQQHTAVLTENGHVYTFGLGVFGQLGHGELRDELYPRCIETFVQEGHTVVDISLGSYYSVARTIDGQVFSWGHGEYGQHGGKENYTDWNVAEFDGNSKDRHHYHSIPRPLVGFEGRNIIAVSGGHLHSVAVTDDQSLYSWGWGASGCLGHGDRRFQLVPKIVSSLQGESIAAVCAGFKHTLIVKAGHQSTFALDYQGLLDNKAYSDMIFQVDGKTIQGHRSILCARSPYINKMVLMQQRFFKPEQVTTLKIPGVKYNVFMSLLRYLYTDHLKIAPHLAKDLVMLAAKFEVPRLVAMCKRTVFSLRDENLTIPDSTFTQDILQLVNNSASFPDVVFNLQDSRVYGHKAVLKSRCKYFERLFESDFKEKDQTEFQVDENISQDTFVAVLKYIYGNDQSIIQPENAVDLLQAADRFMMEDLRQTLEYFIEQGVDLENVAWLLEISDRFGAPKLKRVCTELVLSNKDNLNIIRNTSAFSDIRISSPHLVRELDFKASKVNLSNPGELMRPTPIIQVQ